MFKIRNILAPVVAALGIYMIYLGQQSGIQPPVVTGIGFILIAAIILLPNRRN